MAKFWVVPEDCVEVGQEQAAYEKWVREQCRVPSRPVAVVETAGDGTIHDAYHGELPEDD